MSQADMRMRLAANALRMRWNVMRSRPNKKKRVAMHES
jgi:hypothetical protein